MQSVSEEIKIRPIFNTQGVCVINSVLYTGYECTLFGTNSQNEIVEQLELESEIVKIFPVYDKVLISTITGKVYVYNPAERNNKLQCVFTNSVIKSIDLDGEAIVLGTADGSVILSDVQGYGETFNKKMDGMITLVKFISLSSIKRRYNSKNKLVAVGDAMGTVTLFNTTGEVVYREKNCHSGQIMFIGELGNKILSCGMDALLIEHSLESEMTIRNISENIDETIGACSLVGDRLFMCSKDLVITLSADLKIVAKKRLNIPDINGFDVFGECCVITTDEHDIVLASVVQDTLVVDKVLIGDNDEITDLLVMENMVVVGTNSRYIRTICKSDIERQNENGLIRNKAFSGELVKSNNEECVLSMCGSNKVFYTGSKDGIISKFEVVTGNIRDSVRAVKSVSAEAPITAMCLYQDLLITGTEYGIINGWKIGDTLELVFTASASSSEITGIVVNNKKIHCTSKTKEIIVVNLNGGMDSSISGHKKGMWSISEHCQMLLTGSSDKTARLWKGDINSTLQHNTSVVKTLLTERAITATSDGVLRVWNTTTYKELGAIRITEIKDERIWAIKRYAGTEYIVSAGPSIVIIKDSSWEVEKMKEQMQKEEYIAKQHAIIFMKKGEYVSAAVEYYKLNLERDLKDALKRITGEMDISPLMSVVLLDSYKFVKRVSKWARSPYLFTITQRILQTAIENRIEISAKEADDLSKTLLRTAELFNAAY
ncbi:U3 small nucleolar RNA-associated protein 13 [Nematocida sp. ERTm5]|nr:U3 small nucleolar RNA-associated protein 13 [Nematocida sp. ERTm5]